MVAPGRLALLGRETWMHPFHSYDTFRYGEKYVFTFVGMLCEKKHINALWKYTLNIHFKNCTMYFNLWGGHWLHFFQKLNLAFTNIAQKIFFRYLIFVCVIAYLQIPLHIHITMYILGIATFKCRSRAEGAKFYAHVQLHSQIHFTIYQ